MKNKPLISVVVPVYNVEKYVEQCIRSIINQTYKSLEIIVVDDGSTDKSGKICDDLSAIDSRIKVIHKKNGGLADARNVGIDHANGDLIGFVDSDDYIHPDFYEELYNLMKEKETDIAECQFLRVDVENIENVKGIIDDANSNIESQVVVEDNIDALRHLYGPRLQPYIKKVVVWNKLYKKSLFNDVRFPVGKLHEDEFTTYKILYKCKNLVSTNKIMHGYMQTKNSIMRKIIKKQRIDDNLKAYEDAYIYFKENNNQELEYKVLRRYLENCIELAGKVFKEQSEDKNQKLLGISKIYDDYYNKFIEGIVSNVEDSREYEIIDLLKEAKKDSQYDYINPLYWEKLEKIINKD